MRLAVLRLISKRRATSLSRRSPDSSGMTSKVLKPEAWSSTSLTDEAHQTFPDGLSIDPAHEDSLVPARRSLDHGDLRSRYPEEPRQVMLDLRVGLVPGRSCGDGDF